jgi:hypothetical protein
MDFLNYLGNHEIKLVLAAMLATRPDESFDSGQLRSQFIAAQGPDPAWDKAIIYTSLPRYVEHSLAKCGAASVSREETDGSGRASLRYQGDAERAPRVLAFGGAVLGWSLDYPEMSLQQILGRQSDDKQPSPETRHEIYAHLLSDPSNGTSTAKIFHGFGLPGYQWLDVTHQVYRLEQLGIVDITSNKMLHYNPTFTLDGGTNHFVAKSAEAGTTPEQRILYLALNSLVRDTPATYNLQDFIDACGRIDIGEPYDLSRVRRLLVQNRTKNTRIGLRFDNTDHNPADYTTVVMSPRYVEPITDLCSRLAALDDPELAALYRGQGANIIANKDAVKRLVAKGRRFSVRVRSWDQPNELSAKLLEMVRDLGSVSVKQATTTLAATEDVVWDLETVSSALRRLATAGQLQTTKVQPDPSKKRTVTHYGLPEEVGG